MTNIKLLENFQDELSKRIRPSKAKFKLDRNEESIIFGDYAIYASSYHHGKFDLYKDASQILSNQTPYEIINFIDKL